MKFKKIWENLLSKDGRLNNDDTVVEFTAGNLRRLLRQVYEQGQKHPDDTPAPASAPTQRRDPPNPFDSVDKMSDIFK